METKNETTASEFASTLDLGYKTLKEIGTHIKKELKDLVNTAEWAIYNAMKEAKHALQHAPSVHTFREGSITQQAIARQKVVDLLAKLDGVKYSGTNEKVNKHVEEAKDVLIEILEKTKVPAPVVIPNPEGKVEEEVTNSEILETEKKTDGGSSGDEKLELNTTDTVNAENPENGLAGATVNEPKL